jgi:hypothetical protein
MLGVSIGAEYEDYLMTLKANYGSHERLTLQNAPLPPLCRNKPIARPEACSRV